MTMLQTTLHGNQQTASEGTHATDLLLLFALVLVVGVSALHFVVI